MKDEDKTREQLISELAELRQRIAELVASETERKQAEEALQESEEKFGAIFRKSLDVLMIIDSERGQILNVSQAAHRILGYESDELVGKHFSVLFPPASESKEDALEKYRVYGAVFESQEFLCADGSICPMDLTVTLIPWGKSRVIFATFRDITERKRTEEALRQFNVELQARNEDLNAFAHAVAHGLKTPLSTIVGYAGLLAGGYAKMSEEEVRQYARAIEKIGSKMNSIIEGLMLLSGVRRTRVEMEPLDMAGVVAEVEQRLAPMIEEYQAEVIWPASWPTALGYGPWVEEVWVNYLSNAIKYGGQPPRVEVGAAVKPEGTVRFWVRDNGPGLTPEAQARLFIPFERLEQAHATGHGLGLSIVRRLVERMGGQVGVESDGVQGSTFSFTLPESPRAA